DAELAGLVPPLAGRSTDATADFIDTTGGLWTVASPSPFERGPDDTYDMSTTLSGVETELLAGHSVIIDTANLSDEEAQALEEEIALIVRELEASGELDGVSVEVVFVPAPSEA